MKLIIISQQITFRVGSEFTTKVYVFINFFKINEQLNIQFLKVFKI